MTPFGASSSPLTVQSTAHPLLEAGQTYWVGMNGANGGLAVWNQTTSSTAGLSATDGAGNWSAEGGIQGAVELDGTLVFETPVPVPDPAPAPPDGPIALLPGSAEPQQEELLVVPEPGAFGLTALWLAAALLVLFLQGHATSASAQTRPKLASNGTSGAPSATRALRQREITIHSRSSSSDAFCCVPPQA